MFFAGTFKRAAVLTYKLGVNDNFLRVRKGLSFEFDCVIKKVELFGEEVNGEVHLLREILESHN